LSFIGADGGLASGKEGQKEKFLLEIEGKFNGTVMADDAGRRVVGMWFYNEEKTKEEAVNKMMVPKMAVE
jgi:hypothetical protein